MRWSVGGTLAMLLPPWSHGNTVSVLSCCCDPVLSRFWDKGHFRWWKLEAGTQDLSQETVERSHPEA